MIIRNVSLSNWNVLIRYSKKCQFDFLCRDVFLFTRFVVYFSAFVSLYLFLKEFRTMVTSDREQLLDMGFSPERMYGKIDYLLEYKDTVILSYMSTNSEYSVISVIAP